ncbi:hypothetical protein [Streptomyces sp. NBC_01190]|uniref:hypothetical protein n=1 Tax=Streptomyces sp. NBC_01190 TaxID=2903767 RepID=UPI003866364E|nr:hypothetical protein OG519_14135 [Streptomyces sp. NBC_01190]
MTGPWPSPLTWERATALVEAETRQIETRQHAIRELRTDHTFVSLSNGSRRDSLDGVTKRRWDSAYTALTLAESRCRKWKNTVDKAADLVERNTAPGPPAASTARAARQRHLERVEDLMCGEAITLSRDEMRPADRPAPGSPAPERRFGLAYVKALITDDLDEVRRLVAEVAAVWDPLLRQLETLTRGVHDCERFLPVAGGIGDRAALAALTGRLDRVRAVVENDPLATGAGGAHEHTARPAEIDAISGELDRIRRRLTAALGPRGQRSRILRQRLDLYRRQARHGGHTDHPGLGALYDEARRLMRSGAGQDLDAVERAVQAYAREVWRLDGHGVDESAYQRGPDSAGPDPARLDRPDPYRKEPEPYRKEPEPHREGTGPHHEERGPHHDGPDPYRRGDER